MMQAQGPTSHVKKQRFLPKQSSTISLLTSEVVNTMMWMQLFSSGCAYTLCLTHCASCFRMAIHVPSKAT
jgi:hypothetical protein